MSTLIPAIATPAPVVPADDRRWDDLTPAELRVVRLIADGLSNKEIAGALHLSRYTVETHLKHVFSKLALTSRAGLAARFARREMSARGYLIPGLRGLAAASDAHPARSGRLAARTPDTGREGAMVFAADLVALLLRQAGDRYHLGHEVPLDEANPDTFDCSELLQWACARLGVRPAMPDGTWIQIRHCRRHGTESAVEEAVTTQGALLFRFGSDPFAGGRPSSAHVAVSLGNGSTIEARGRRWGVGSWDANRRGWTHAALVPGVAYAAPPGPPEPGRDGAGPPAWPGRFLAQPPPMSGPDVEQWQRRMVARDLVDVADGEYGPASERACRDLPARAGLKVDGIVGPDTWTATFDT